MATITGTTGDETLTGTSASDDIHGLEGNDTLYGREGDDQLHGGAGNDALHGEGGSDLLDGGAGNDYLRGDGGSDTYLLRTGSGIDTILAYDPTSGRVDTVRFEDVPSTGLVAVRRLGDDLVLEYGDGDRVTIQSHFGHHYYAMSQFQFSDGVTWTTAQLLAAHPVRMTDGNDTQTFTDHAETILAGAGHDTVHAAGGNDTLLGETGNDALYGGDGNDVLDGGVGNDYLRGESGSDTYLFRAGSGIDTVLAYDPTSGRVDTLQFEDVPSTGPLAVRRLGDDLVLEYGDGDRVTIQSHFGHHYYAMSQFRFSDGVTWTTAQLLAAHPVRMTDGNDTQTFTDHAETILAGAGDDTVHAAGGDDTVLGETGNDALYGGDGGDVLDGGVGNDFLRGESGSDTYLLRAGSGIDTVLAYDTSSGRVDTLRFEDVASTGLTRVQRLGDNLVLHYGDGDQVTVQNHFNHHYYAISQFAFSDGVTWTTGQLLAAYPVHMTDGGDTQTFSDHAETILAGGGDDAVYAAGGNDTLLGETGNDALYGGDGNDVLDGGVGNDHLRGEWGNDTYLLRTGSGIDSIYTYDSASGRVDTLRFEDVPSTGPLTVRRLGDDLVLEYGTGDRVTVQHHFQHPYYSISRIQFSDGVTWTPAQLLAAYPIRLTDGNDSQTMTDNPETILAGAGDDSVSGAGGNDTILGEAGNDALYGGDGSDVLDGGVGSDHLRGESGSDTYLLRRGSGIDSIYTYESAGGRVDTIRFEDVASTELARVQRVGDHLVLHYGDGDQVTVQHHFNHPYYSITRVQFSDGVAWTPAELMAAYPLHLTDGDDSLSMMDYPETVLAGAGADTVYGAGGNDVLLGEGGHDALYGGDGNDVLDGGVGNDHLRGESGSDTYLLRRGSGIDSIYTYESAAGRVDTVRFEDVASTELARVQRAGDHLVLHYGDGDQVTVQHHFSHPYYQVSRIQFSDGVTWTPADLLAAYPVDLTEGDDSVGMTDVGETVYAGAGADSVQGNGGDDRIFGEGGDDTLYGGAGTDTLDGGAGHDRLWGEAAADTLRGGTGNDALYGGESNDLLDGGTGHDHLRGDTGSDTYLVRLGAGRDTVDTYDWTSGRVDVLRFEDVPSTGLTGIRTSGHDLVLEYGDGDSVTLQGHFHGATYQVTRYEFSDGVAWTTPQLFEAYAVTLSDGDDGLSFTDASETLFGSAGHDTVYAYGGDDVVDGGTGNDHVQGGNGGDTLRGGADHDTLHGQAGSDALEGGTGNDALYGGDGGDVLDGGAGSDYATGGSGSDTFVLRRGSGRDTLEMYDPAAGRVDVVRWEDVPSTGITALRTSGYDLVIEYGDGDAVTLQGHFHGANYQATRYEFSDGVTWTAAQLLAAYPVTGTEGNDSLTFDNGAETVLGGAGDDSLYVQGGDDVVDAGTGHDHVQGGAGRDTLRGGAGHDTLHGQAGDDALEGGTGNDALYGSDGADVLDGGAGNDYLNGGDGSDVFVLRAGAGHDTVHAYDASAGRVDVVRWEDVPSTGITGLRTSGYDLVIEYGDGDSVTLQGHFHGAGYQATRYEFSDGVSWTAAQLLAAHPVDGSESNDSLSFADGSERVSGGGGDDSLYVYGGDDVVDAGTGHDHVQGGAGGDTLRGGAGHDTLHGQAGDDALEGGTGHDTLYGGDGADVMDGGAGNDHLRGDAGSDTFVLRAGSGLDTLDTYDPTAGRADVLRWEDVASTGITGLRTSGYDLVIEYGDGDAVTIQNHFHGASYQATRYEFADGVSWTTAQLLAAYPVAGSESNDSLNFSDGAERVSGGGGDDGIYTHGGEDVVDAGTGHDTVQAGAGNDTVAGGAGHDSLMGQAGDDALDGGTGNDTLQGGDGADRLDGGAGNDHLRGEAGSDTYVVRRGGGRDTVDTYDTTAGRVDELRFADVASTEVTAIRTSGFDLVIEFGTGDAVTLQNHFHGANYQVTRYAFADGVTWTAAELLSAYAVTASDANDGLGFTDGAETLAGGAGDDTFHTYGGDDVVHGGTGHDTLYAGAGDDLLEGGEGNDHLRGEAGSDTYVVRRGGGRDTIFTHDTTAGRVDTLRLVDVYATDLTAVRRDGNDLVLEWGEGEAVTVQGHFASGQHAMSVIEFADGTTWTAEHLASSSVTELYWVPEGYTVTGGEGDDWVTGDVGSDRLYGRGGHDLLDGGELHDFLEGGAGSDTYLVRTGAGRDTIQTYDSGAGRVDVLRFEDVPSTGLTALRTSGYDLVIEYGNGDSVTVQGHFHSGLHQLSRYEFSDGASWTTAQLFEAYPVTLSEGNETLGFTSGGETLHAGGGNDTVYAYGGDDVVDGGTGHDQLQGGDGADTLRGGADNDTLYGQGGGDVMEGGTGHDSLYGDAGADVLDGGAGNDYLNGGDGSDVFLLRAGSGHDTVHAHDASAGRVDVVRWEDVASTGITAVRTAGYDLVIEYGDGDSVTLQNHFHYGGWPVTRFEFADGVAWTPAELLAAYPVTLSEGNETLGFTGAAERVWAGAGDDAVYTYGGDDVVHGGTGHDHVQGGDGADTLRGEADNDTLHGQGGQDLLEGGTGHDALHGGDAADVLDGGDGNDYLHGGDGSDVFVLRAGAGHDTVAAYDITAGRVDVVRWEDVASTGITAVRSSGYDLVIEYGDGDSVTLQGHFHYGGYAVTRLEFADGVAWTPAELFAAYPVTLTEGHESLGFSGLADRVWAGAGDDTVYTYGGDDVVHGGTGHDQVQGGDGADTLRGEGDNDTLHGQGGDDLLEGGTGHDTLYGGDAADRLDGGTGNDHLRGDLGNDTYVLRAGAGHDTLDTYDYVAGKQDVLRFEDVASTGITAVRTSGYDLVIEYGDGDSITIQGHFHGAGWQVARYEFADGVTWTTPQLLGAFAVTGSESNDSLHFTDASEDVSGSGGHDGLYTHGGDDRVRAGAGDDTVQAGAGNDAVQGQAGGDALHGQAGDDALEGGTGGDALYGGDGVDWLDGGADDDFLRGDGGSDVYVLRAGAGRDTVDAYDTSAGRVDVLRFEDVPSTGITALRASGYDLVIEYGGGDSVTVQGHFHGAAYQLTRYEFADGVSWTPAQLLAALPVTLTEGDDRLSFGNEAETIAAGGGHDTVHAYGGDDAVDGGIGNDTLHGGTGRDTLRGEAGNDTLHGDADDDALQGGTGHDALYGGDGADRMDGGAGDDYLRGDAGDDVFVLRLGAGADTINAWDTGAGRVDTVLFEDVDSTGLTAARREGNHLVLEYGAGDSVVVENHFYHTGYRVARFQFADGVTWTPEELLAAYAPVAAASADTSGTMEGTADGADASAEGAAPATGAGASDGERSVDGVVTAMGEGGTAEGGSDGEGAMDGVVAAMGDGSGTAEGGADGAGSMDGVVTTMGGSGTEDGAADGASAGSPMDGVVGALGGSGTPAEGGSGTAGGGMAGVVGAMGGNGTPAAGTGGGAAQNRRPTIADVVAAMGGTGSGTGAATLQGVAGAMEGGDASADASEADGVNALAAGGSTAASVHDQADSLLRVLAGLSGGEGAAQNGTAGVAALLDANDPAAALPVTAGAVDQQLESLVSAMAAFAPLPAAQSAQPRDQNDALNALLAADPR